MPETEMLTRREARASSVNVEDRTVELVFASSTPVTRRSFQGAYDEVLQISPEAIDRSRLDSMQLLDTHDTWSVDAILGSVVQGSFRIEGQNAIATVKLSRKRRAQEVLDDLADGHRLPVSVGYRIMKSVEAEKDGKRTITATKWLPMEISVVPVPADPAAQTRKEEDMSESETKTRPAGKTSARAEKEIRAKLKIFAGNRDEAEIRAMAEELIQRGTTAGEFNEAVLDRMAEIEERTPTHAETTSADRTLADRSQRDARVDALVARATGKAPPEAARPYMSLSLEGHARGILEEAGIHTFGMSRQEVFGQRNIGGLHGTSDFPALLQESGHRILMAAYEAEQSPLKTKLSKSTTIQDFRSRNVLKISGGGKLEKVNEHGEIQRFTRSETKEAYKLESYAGIFGLTRNAAINDDLSAFADQAKLAGRMSAETENGLLFELLVSNSGAGPTMAEDDTALFHADHNNLTATLALDVDGLDTVRQAMRSRTDVDGVSRISVTPAFLLVGPALETKAEKLLASLNATKTDDANPFSGRLELLVEPRLSGTSWFVFASPMQAPVLEWAHLTGAPGPQTSQREGFDVLGVEFRTVLDFGAGAIDWRGGYRVSATS